MTIQRRCIFNEIDLIYRPGEPLTMNTISTFYTNALEGIFKSESAALFSNFDQKIQDILQLHTLTVKTFSVHLQARIFLLNPSDSFVKFSFFAFVITGQKFQQILLPFAMTLDG